MVSRRDRICSLFDRHRHSGPLEVLLHEASSSLPYTFPRPGAEADNPTMTTLTPCLWFDTEAQDAANFYLTVFPNSRIGTVR